MAQEPPSVTAQGLVLAALMGRLRLAGALSDADLTALWRDAIHMTDTLRESGNSLSQVEAERVAAEVSKLMRLLAPPVPEPGRGAPR